MDERRDTSTGRNEPVSHNSGTSERGPGEKEGCDDHRHYLQHMYSDRHGDVGFRYLSDWEAVFGKQLEIPKRLVLIPPLTARRHARIIGFNDELVIFEFLHGLSYSISYRIDYLLSRDKQNLQVPGKLFWLAITLEKNPVYKPGADCSRVFCSDSWLLIEQALGSKQFAAAGY